MGRLLAELRLLGEKMASLTGWVSGAVGLLLEGVVRGLLDTLQGMAVYFLEGKGLAGEGAQVHGKEC